MLARCCISTSTALVGLAEVTARERRALACERVDAINTHARVLARGWCAVVNVHARLAVAGEAAVARAREASHLRL